MTNRDESLTFKTQDRLHKTDEFSSVFVFRKQIRGNFFALHYRPNQLGRARLGLVMPKKYAKKAVLRNLAKRQSREVFRHMRADLPANDFVVRLLAPIANAHRAAIYADLQALFKRAGR